MFNNKKDGVILLDVDGPCANFDEHLLEMVNPNITIEDMRNLGDWDIFKLLDRHELGEAHKIMETYEFWRNQPVKQAALDAYQKIKSMGARVVFCTSPWMPCERWFEARYKWICEHFGKIDRKDFAPVADKTLVWGDIIIDDKPSTVHAWQKKWGNREQRRGAVLFETHCNHKDPYYPRIITVDRQWKFVDSEEERNELLAGTSKESV